MKEYSKRKRIRNIKELDIEELIINELIIKELDNVLRPDKRCGIAWLAQRAGKRRTGTENREFSVVEEAGGELK